MEYMCHHIGCSSEEDAHGYSQMHVRLLPPSLFVRVGWPCGPTSSIKRSLRSRPNQVSRQDPAGQQSWTCVCPRAPPAGTLLLHTAHTRHAQPPIKANMARPLSRMIVSSAWPCAPNNKVGQGQSYCLNYIPNKSVGSSLVQPISADRSPNGKHRASIQDGHEEA
jgi:hypothetical protein